MPVMDNVAQSANMVPPGSASVSGQILNKDPSAAMMDPNQVPPDVH